MFVLPIFLMGYDNRFLGEYVCTKVLGKQVDVNNDLFGGVATSLIMLLGSSETDASTVNDPSKDAIKENLCLAGTVISSFIVFIIY